MLESVNDNTYQGGDSQNFLRTFVIFFVTLRCLYGVVIHRKPVFYVFTVVSINFYLYLLQKLVKVIRTSRF